VLQDNHFRWLARISLDPAVVMNNDAVAESESGVDSGAQMTSMLLYFPCGIIRGALTNLGIPCAVSADMSNLPACKFPRDRCLYVI
jgi:trafficking protein particle complex subunit 6